MRALIGNTVQTPTGQFGKVTGINSDTQVVRVALGGAVYADIPYHELKRQCRYCGGWHACGQSCVCFDNDGQ